MQTRNLRDEKAIQNSPTTAPTKSSKLAKKQESNTRYLIESS